MLLSFRFANHRSIRDEQQLLLTPAYRADRVADTDWPAVPVAGIFGANAAGKSNVLKALSYMRSMVVNSLRDAEPQGGVRRRPFCLDPDMAGASSSYVVDIILEHLRYTYGFTVNDERVLDEWLYRYQPTKRYRNGRRTVIFERDGDSFDFGDASDDTMNAVGAITGANVLLLSIAARSRQPDMLPLYRWFAELGCLLSRSHPWQRVGARTMRMLSSTGDDRVRLLDLVRAADLGITDIELPSIRDEDLPGDVDSVLGHLLPRSVDRSQLSFDFVISRELRTELSRRMLRHGIREEDRLSFAHHGAAGDGTLTLDEQSQGTLTLLNLAGDVLSALDNGGLLAIDEIDASLHPLLSARLITLFQARETNPRGAQLLFTSHDATLLGRLHGQEVLKRDQVWFVEKDSCGATSLFPLSDFKPRQDENRERRYLNGSYGAVPVVPADLFEHALRTREDWPGGSNSEE